VQPVCLHITTLGWQGLLLVHLQLAPCMLLGSPRRAAPLRHQPQRSTTWQGTQSTMAIQGECFPIKSAPRLPWASRGNGSPTFPVPRHPWTSRGWVSQLISTQASMASPGGAFLPPGQHPGLNGAPGQKYPLPSQQGVKGSWGLPPQTAGSYSGMPIPTELQNTGLHSQAQNEAATRALAAVLIPGAGPLGAREPPGVGEAHFGARSSSTTSSNGMWEGQLGRAQEWAVGGAQQGQGQGYGSGEERSGGPALGPPSRRCWPWRATAPARSQASRSSPSAAPTSSTPSSASSRGPRAPRAATRGPAQRRARDLTLGLVQSSLSEQGAGVPQASNVLGPGGPQGQSMMQANGMPQAMGPPRHQHHQGAAPNGQHPAGFQEQWNPQEQWGPPSPRLPPSGYSSMAETIERLRRRGQFGGVPGQSAGVPGQAAALPGAAAGVPGPAVGVPGQASASPRATWRCRGCRGAGGQRRRKSEEGAGAGWWGDVVEWKEVEESESEEGRVRKCRGVGTDPLAGIGVGWSAPPWLERE